MACFMIGSRLFLVLGHDHRAPFGTHHDLVLGFFEFEHGDKPLALTRREQRRFVGKIGQIGA